MTPAGRIGWINYEQGNSTAAPTQTHLDGYAIAKEEIAPILDDIKSALIDLENLENMLEDADAPYTPGRVIRLLQGN